MKKILFDLLSAQPVGNTKFHGGGEYIKRVFIYMVENFIENTHISVFYDYDKYIDDYVLNAINTHEIDTFDIKKIDELSGLLNSNKYEVFYTGIPYYYNNIVFPDNIVCVGTFHGFRTLEKYNDDVEKYYYDGIKVLKPLLKKIFSNIKIREKYRVYNDSLKKFNKIICDSLHTKYALKYFFPDFSSDNVINLYAPAKYIDLSEIDIYKTEIAEFGKFILIIGLNRWEKNGSRALISIDNLFSKNLILDYNVVTLGKIPDKLFKKIKNKEHFIRKDYVSATYLEELYRNCDIFFYPSLNEGFGMPPFEAMKYGRTCIVSAVCSLPELCENAVYYVNPYDLNEMCNRILLASEKKIDENMVVRQYDKVYMKQKEDLEKICLYILGYLG